MLRPMMRTGLLLLGIVALAAGCKSEIDPGYKAALEARHEAICACLKEKGQAAVSCQEAAEKQHPEPAVPGGKPVGEYRASLDEKGIVFARKMDDLTAACATELNKYVADYKKSVEEQAQAQKKQEEAAALSKKMAAANPAPKATKGKSKKKKKHHR